MTDNNELLITAVITLIFVILLSIIIRSRDNSSVKLMLALKQNLDVGLISRKYFWQSSFLEGKIKRFPISIREGGRSENSTDIVIKVSLPQHIFDLRIMRNAKIYFLKPDLTTGNQQLDKHYLIKSKDLASATHFLDNKAILKKLTEFSVNFRISDEIRFGKNHIYYYLPSTNITTQKKKRFLKAVELMIFLAEQLTKRSV